MFERLMKAWFNRKFRRQHIRRLLQERVTLRQFSDRHLCFVDIEISTYRIFNKADETTSYLVERVRRFHSKGIQFTETSRQKLPSNFFEVQSR